MGKWAELGERTITFWGIIVPTAHLRKQVEGATGVTKATQLISSWSWAPWAHGRNLHTPPKTARSYSPQFQSAQPDHCSTHPLHFTLLQQPPVSTSFGPPKLLSSSIMYLEDMFKLVWHTYTEVESYTRNNIRIILTSSNKIQPGRGDKSTKKASQRQKNWEKKTKQGRTASGYTRQQSTRLTLLEASPPSALNPISLSDNISARSPYD